MNEASRFKKAVDMLEEFYHDYQFDESHEMYYGFINIGPGMFRNDDLESTWEYICHHKELFEKILPHLGLDTEEGIHLEETILVRKKI